MEKENTFKRLDENRIALDGIIWDNRPEKSIKISNLDSGNMVHSINVQDIFYYPASFDKDNRNKKYAQIIEK